MKSVQDDLEIIRKRLRFRSWHRGTKEMDLLLGSFADRHLPDLDAGDLAQYEDLLQNNDPDLYNWITGQEDPPANIISDVFEKLRRHQFA